MVKTSGVDCSNLKPTPPDLLYGNDYRHRQVFLTMAVIV